MLKKGLLFFVFIVLLSFAGFSSPQPRCVSVLPNGNVTLTWSIATGFSGTFNNYEIYSSNNYNGPYALVTTIANINQISYTHTTVNANAARVYYYLRMSSNSGGIVYSTPLDTVSSMKLTVTNPANGTAVLNWNAVATPNIPTSHNVYTVYVEYPAGTWTPIGSKNSTSYIDTIKVCNNLINYRVEIADSAGCTSVSSIDGGVFQNIIVPAIPVFDTLSVDNNNNAQMSWNVNPSPDVEAYVIYKFNGTTWVPIDTVFGINNISYTYLLSNAHQSSEQYRFAAYDTCGNISPLGTAHSTMYLRAASDICSRSAILTWTAYGTIGTGLSGYRIYKSTSGANGPYVLVGTVSSTTVTFTESGLPPNTTYHYKIEAFDNSGLKTASSNRLSFFSVAPIPPVFSYFRNASVISPNRIEVKCHVDIAASTKAYKIMRSTSGATGSYQLIATIPVTGATPIVHTDTRVFTDKSSYYYKMINVDSCGFDGMETNVAQTMLLTAISNSDNLTNTLTWNDYSQWLGNVASYNIYRGVDGIFNPVPIANVPYSGLGTNTFVDDVSAELNGQGVFNYYVEAIEGGGNIYGFSETSLSNVASAYQDAKIFIPNAFKPFAANSVNTVFIPVTTYVDLKEYEFIIFNRWGQKLFTTNDINKGWNGTTASGTKCELGVYVYMVMIKTSKGEYIERKGTVTLLR